MVDKSEKFRWLVRLGYAVRGVVYVLIGYLALTTARGDKGPEGAFNWLQDAPFGSPLLYVAALGLVAYALYKFCSLLFDVENKGGEPKGLVMRVGHAASGVGYLVLAYTAFQFAQGEKQAPSSDGAQEAAGTVLSVPFGSLVLGIVGLGFLVSAFFQAKSAFTRSFMDDLSSRTPEFVEYLGRAGLLARSIVFVLIGWSMIRSAWFDSETQIKTLGDSVNALASTGTLYTIIAFGLLVFGIFSLFVARYRIVPDLARSDLKPRLH